MKLYNVTLQQWSDEHREFVEYDRQYVGEREGEAIEEAEQKNPGATVLYAVEIGEVDEL